MVKEAEQFADQDKKKREEAELRNNADSMIYTAEKTKKDLADKLTAEQNGKIDAAVTALKDALAKADMTAIKAKSDELGKVLQDIGTVIYQQAAAQAQAQQQAQGTQGQPGQAESQPGPSEQAESGEKVVDSEDYKVK